MPLGFLIIGVIVLLAALRNTHKELGSLVAADFTGSNSFLYWIAALAVIGGLGYIPAFRGPSRMLLVLIFLSFILKNGSGFFQQFSSAIAGVGAGGATATDTTGAPPPGEPAAPGPIPVQLSGGGSAGAAGLLGQAGSAASGLSGLANTFGGSALVGAIL